VKRVLILLFVAVSVISCDPPPVKDKGEVLAKVDGYYLYEADLANAIPIGTPTRDSIFLAKNFIDNWIKNRLLIRQAERNLTPRQLDFSQKLEEYRNSLIVYAYETELIRQMLDTIVDDSEIEKYYVENIANFELKHNIVKVIYVIIPYQSYETEIFRKLLKSPEVLMLDSIDYYARQYALAYHLDEEEWIPYNQLLMQIPLEEYSQELFLQQNEYIEIEEEPFTFMVLFVDYMTIGSTSPLELVNIDIKNIILNKRKRQLIRQMHHDLFEQALKEKVFEIY
jgi:hypothetical protein